MMFRLIACLAGAVLVWTAQLPAASTYFPVDEVRPGMIGKGVTVFEGARRDEFKVHLLGVLKNIIAPGRSLVLARLEGGPLAQTGVIAGMSGSPVYIDGRLLGAVSYSLGSFSKEAIAGITPINEMIEAAALTSKRAVTAQAALDMPLTREGLAAAMRHAFTRTRAFADSGDQVRAVGLPAAEAGQLGLMLRPIATPLVLSGFSGDALDLLSSTFRDQGFVPVVGAGAASMPQLPTEPLQGGDPIGVSLVRGDFEYAATGTVTLVDKDTVYAFGHPFFNLGPTEFPMTRAHVFTLLPSLMSSSKVSVTGDIIGTVRQDRATTIAGTLGKGPSLIPVSIALDSGRGVSKKFNFQVVNDQVLTPLLTYVSIVNTLGSWEREFGAASFTVKGNARVKGHGTIAFEDIFTGDTASMGAASYVVAPLTLLLKNNFEPIEVERVDLTISSAEEPKTASIARVWINEFKPRPGQTVHVNVLTRTYRGEESTRTVPIVIPAHASGTMSIMVSDGARLTQLEQRELRQTLQADSIGQMLKAINRVRKNNRLYVRLLGGEAGAIVNGEPLPALPPSVLAVLEGDRNGGSFAPLQNASLGEWEVATDFALSGSRVLTFSIGSR